MGTQFTFEKSRKSLEDYFNWRVERTKPIIKNVHTYLKLKKGVVALDIGCGYGALSTVLIECGVKVFATETDGKKLGFAKKKLGSKNFVAKLVSDEKLPFKNNFFDVVFLFDVIEHVKNPGRMLSEVFRVLKDEGLVYCEFTPYYCLAGHHLYDYTKLPVHLYKSKASIEKMIRYKKPQNMFTVNYYLGLYDSLNKLEISDFQHKINAFRPVYEKYFVKYPEKFEIELPFLKYLPSPLKDLFCFSFEGLYKKDVISRK